MPVKERPIVAENENVPRPPGIAVMAFFLLVLEIPMTVQPIYEMTALHAEEWAQEVRARDAEIQRRAKAGKPPDPETLPEVNGRFSRLQVFELYTKYPLVDPEKVSNVLLGHINSYEDALADESYVAILARPYTQLIQTSTIRQGNEKVMIGKDGWLFHRPGVYFVTGFPFRSHYVKNDAKVPPDRWDPGPAIFGFWEQLKTLGVELAMVPLPVKAQIYPENLTSRYDLTRGPPANLQAYDFYYDMRDAGMGVFDVSQTLWDAKGEGQVYLKLDTHWTQRGMKTAARELAGLLRARYPALFASLPPSKDRFTTRTLKVKRHGDLFYQLNLPPWSQAFPEQEVEIEQVIDEATGEPVSRSNPDADIVLLGDSFTNIYSTEEPTERGMRWGTGAGLSEHLMMELGRKIHVIALNGGAPTGTRETLARQRITRAGTDADTEVKIPLIKTKKLVVWSFATRELITPDTVWKQIQLPTGEHVRNKSGEGADEPIEVVARIVVKSSPPVPGADPYREAVTMTLYEVVRVESGTLVEKRFVAAEWVMKDLKLLTAARYKVGDVHRLRMIPFDVKTDKTPGLAQVKQLDDTEVYESPYWVESAIPVQE